MQQVKKFHEQIPALAGMTYLDSAGAGLPPLSVTKAMKRLIDDWSSTGEHWEEWLLDVVETRKLFSKLIGASADEIGVIPSVSFGLAAIASSLNYSKKDKVVTSSLNFPTNIILWQRMREEGLLRDVEALQHENGGVPIEAYEKAIDDRTAIVSVDYVSWLSGYRERVREISEIAHKHNSLFVVDAFHALGVFPFDAKKLGIDVLVSGFYKWMCGPHGVACIYTDENVLQGLKPAYLGWHGVQDNVIERIQQNRDAFDVPFPHDRAKVSSTAARFEWGTWASVAVIGALESIRFALEWDSDSRFQVIKKRREELLEGLREFGMKLLNPDVDANPGSGIVTFEAKEHNELAKKLGSYRIVVSGRFGYIRVSPHFYNTSEDIDKFLEAMKKIWQLELG